MAVMPGIPYDQGKWSQGTIKPVGVVCHRTYGSWKGDYAVGKGSKRPVGFHFLVGKAQGNWVQFYNSTTRCAHTGTNRYGNDLAIGIEVEGRNEEPMTQWQIDRCREIVNWIAKTHGIKREYLFSTAHDLKANYGFIPHSAVKSADHSDYWTKEDWAKIVRTPPAPVKPPVTTPPPASGTVNLYVEGGGTVNLRVLKKGHEGRDVRQMQALLEEWAISPGPHDGKFGNGTDTAVRSFQKSKGFPQDGIVGSQTWTGLLGR